MDLLLFQTRDASGVSILPELGVVSSEWEKNDTIRRAYEYARRSIVPQLIHLLEEYARDSWVTSTGICQDDRDREFPRYRIWTNPEYTIVHKPVDDDDDGDDDSTTLRCTTNENNNATNVTTVWTKRRTKNTVQKFTTTTTTEIYLPVTTTTTRKPKGSNTTTTIDTKKCLLRHVDSNGEYYFRVCKLQRRHLKEIAKRSETARISSSSSVFLESLVASAVSKLQSNDGLEEMESKNSATSTSTSTLDSAGKQRQKRFMVLLQQETTKVFGEALSIVRAAKDLEIGCVGDGDDDDKQFVVRWKHDDQLETVHYY